MSLFLLSQETTNQVNYPRATNQHQHVRLATKTIDTQLYVVCSMYHGIYSTNAFVTASIGPFFLAKNVFLLFSEERLTRNLCRSAISTHIFSRIWPFYHFICSKYLHDCFTLPFYSYFRRGMSIYNRCTFRSGMLLLNLRDISMVCLRFVIVLTVLKLSV